jgi:N-acetylglucosaminyldiphosphoundecaprenol N-acetyl-beta-D-mannosaminyltransferase
MNAMTMTMAMAERMKDPPVVRLRGLNVHAVTESGCVDRIMAALAARRGGWVVTPNLDILRRAEHDASFRTMIEEADLRVADGMPLIWASRLQGTPLPERVTGSNLIHSVTAAAAAHGRRLFLLGGDPGTAERAGAILAERHPGLQVVGHLCPPFGFERDAEEMARIEEALTGAQPDIVYVALGAPKQEHLIRRLRAEYPHVWWLGIGISFSFVTGDVRRAPRWVQRIGFEWLHRLCQEPRRLAKRYLVDGLPFAARLLTGSLLHRIRTGSHRAADIRSAEHT